MNEHEDLRNESERVVCGPLFEGGERQVLQWGPVLAESSQLDLTRKRSCEV